MSITVIQAGLQTSIQGAPYRGMRNQAIPASGAADPLGLALANRLVGKESGTLAFEITLSTAGFRADTDMHIAVTGAAQAVHINDRQYPAHARHKIKAGDDIVIPPPMTGARTYLAISRHINLKVAFGSGSTCFSGHFGGLNGSALKDGDAVSTIPTSHAFDAEATPRNLVPKYENAFILRYLDGPEVNWLSDQSALSALRWTASQRMNRMGIALDGDPLFLARQDSLASSAVFPGTIQCPPGGRPFLLGTDGQTSGGYPRVAQIIRADRHLIGQIRPGASVQLVKTNTKDAQKIFRQKMDFWRKYLVSIRLD